MSIAKNMGYTAVILTFDRLPSLFRVIGNLGKTKSLAKIVIIWNNQEKAPPKGNSCNIQSRIYIFFL